MFVKVLEKGNPCLFRICFSYEIKKKEKING